MIRKSQTTPARAGVSRRGFAAGAGAVAIVAGTSPFSIGHAQGAPLKVGGILPLSGAQASIGQDCYRGVEIAPAIFKALGLPAAVLESFPRTSSFVAGAAGLRFVARVSGSTAVVFARVFDAAGLVAAAVRRTGAATAPALVGSRPGARKAADR